MILDITIAPVKRGKRALKSEAFIPDLNLNNKIIFNKSVQNRI